MPTNAPRPPADITTDRLAACVRDGATTQPALTAAAQPVANKLAILIRRRLPDTTPTDTGAVMLHIAAFLADVMTVLTEQGNPVADAVQTATSAIAMAGTELFDSSEAQANTDQAALQAYLDVFDGVPDDSLVDEIDGHRLTVGMLRAAAAALGQRS